MVQIFTDGSSCGRKIGPGGWAFVVLKKSKVIHQAFGGIEIATNNQMELMGPIQALKYLHRNDIEKAEIITDSQYVQKGITNWIHGWKRNGWKSSSGSAVLNKELWVKLHALGHGLELDWTWVRGHNGNEFNELADKLAKQGKAKFMVKA
jgi:ribonuclease HI